MIPTVGFNMRKVLGKVTVHDILAEWTHSNVLLLNHQTGAYIGFRYRGGTLISVREACGETLKFINYYSSPINY